MFLAHRGNNFLDELKYSGYIVDSAFDVGAHYGETLSEIHSQFDSASITCFEPCPEFITQLISECDDIIYNMGERFCLERVAISSEDGISAFVEQGPGSHLVKGNGNLNLSSSDRQSQSVKYVNTVRLDQYVRAKCYSQIDLLKIDVEGHEMDVLEGIGKQLLSRGFFRLIYIEAGVSTDNEHHTPMIKIISYLSQHGYEIFGFYEQVNEFLTSRTHLRRVNIGLVHQTSILTRPTNFTP